jgi:hypothetical protein
MVTYVGGGFPGAHCGTISRNDRMIRSASATVAMAANISLALVRTADPSDAPAWRVPACIRSG